MPRYNGPLPKGKPSITRKNTPKPVPRQLPAPYVRRTRRIIQRITDALNSGNIEFLNDIEDFIYTHPVYTRFQFNTNRPNDYEEITQKKINEYLNNIDHNRFSVQTETPNIREQNPARNTARNGTMLNTPIHYTVNRSASNNKFFTPVKPVRQTVNSARLNLDNTNTWRPRESVYSDLGLNPNH